MKFMAEIEMEVADDKADVMTTFSEKVMQKFTGTAILVRNIKVTQTGAEKKDLSWRDWGLPPPFSTPAV
jgi:hypothetical protein